MLFQKITSQMNETSILDEKNSPKKVLHKYPKEVFWDELNYFILLNL